MQKLVIYFGIVAFSTLKTKSKLLRLIHKMIPKIWVLIQ